MKNKTDVRPNHLCSTLYYMQISLGKGDNSVKMVKDKVTLFTRESNGALEEGRQVVISLEEDRQVRVLLPGEEGSCLGGEMSAKNLGETWAWEALRHL